MKSTTCFLFLLSLAACARVPQSDLAERMDSVSLQSTQESALAQENFEEGEWPKQEWWELFQDPQLSELIERALSENPTLKSALARVSSAEQSVKEQRSSLFPHLDLDYEQNWEYFSKKGFVRDFYPTPRGNRPDASVNQVDLSLKFSYELDFFGRNRHRFEAAINLARAERLEAKLATLIITTLVAQTYVELQAKLYQKQILQEQLSIQESLLDLQIQRMASGLDSAFSSLNAKSTLSSDKQALALLDQAIFLDQHMLSFLVGGSPEELISEPSLSMQKEMPIALPSDLSSDLLARRPDLMAQIYRLESAAEKIGAAQADFYPRVNLIAFAGVERLGFSQLFSLSSRQAALEPAIHLPIFQGGKLRAHLKRQVALFNEETHLYNEMLLRAAKEVADEVSTLQMTFQTLDHQRDKLEAFEIQKALEENRYKARLSDLLSVLQREESVLTERYQLLGYNRDYLLATIKLIKALGGGYHFTDAKEN